MNEAGRKGVKSLLNLKQGMREDGVYIEKNNAISDICISLFCFGC